MKTRDKIYVIVPSILLGMTLIVLILNNYIIGYLPPNILSIYPLWPCWPSDEISNGGPMNPIRNIQFLDEKSSYHIGESINPNLQYATAIDMVTPNIYIKNSENQTVWHYYGHTLKRGECGITLHYALQELTEPPSFNKTGEYEMFAGSENTLATFQFHVTP